MDEIAAGVGSFPCWRRSSDIAALVAIWGLVADPAVVQQQLALLKGIVPEQGFGRIDAQVGNSGAQPLHAPGRVSRRATTGVVL